jgi:hypothetical protein
MGRNRRSRKPVLDPLRIRLITRFQVRNSGFESERRAKRGRFADNRLLLERCGASEPQDVYHR